MALGKTAARRLAEMGAHVVLVGRNVQKTETVAREIEEARVSGSVAVEIANLSLQEDVRKLAARLSQVLPKVDVLINNAGAIFSDRAQTSEQLERTFALNHLAYFTLTLLLLPALYAAGVPGNAARIVNVASRAHFRAQLDLDDLQSVRSFRAWRTYNNSKLENILSTRALSRRLDTSRVVTHSLHPGVVASQFALAGNRLWGKFMRTAMNLRSVSPERGSDTIVHLATAHTAIGRSGLYWDQCAVAEPSAAALDDTVAERLWLESSRLAGIDADRITGNAVNGVTVRHP